MRVSNDTAINLAKSESKTLRAFLLLYTLLALLIIGFVSYIYYVSEKNRMLSLVRLQLQQKSEAFLPRLKYLHYHLDQNQTYPRDPNFKSGIYDLDRRPIFSDLIRKQVDFDQVITLNKGYIQAVFQPEFYYLGSKFIVLEQKDNGVWFQQAKHTILWYASVALGLFLAIGWFLSKLFIRPMRQAVKLLDRFIKDTTHELNTPVTTILSNIESLHTTDAKEQKKLNRIHIAAKTISSLYDDLTFLLLQKPQKKSTQYIDLSQLLKERLEYFDLSFKQKKLTLHTKINQKAFIQGDPIMLSRLLDNLISNAVKYNRIGGSINVALFPNRLSIKDSGIGIDPAELSTIFTRYKRIEKGVGGFGIGLHIVWLIAQDLGMLIDVQSEPQKGTEFILTWKKS